MSNKCYDVSYCQRGLELPSDTHHVIIRLGQRDFLDSECENFIQQCISKNIHFDFYWYLHTTEIDGLSKEFAEISKFFNLMCDKYSLDRNKHLWIDLEKTGQDTVPFIIRVLKIAQDNGFNTGIYMCWAWYNQLMNNKSQFKNVPVWIAWWGVPTDYVKDIPNIHFHQYGTVEINGITVDGDTEIYCCDGLENETSKTDNVSKSVNLYTSAYSDAPITSYSGSYYFYDNEIVNGRRRITSDSFYVGKLPIEKYVTGWIDVDKINETNITPKQGDSFTNIETGLFATAYDNVPVGKTSKNMHYYFYDNDIINGKRRISVDKEHINSPEYYKYVTGWIIA